MHTAGFMLKYAVFAFVLAEGEQDKGKNNWEW